MQGSLYAIQRIHLAWKYVCAPKAYLAMSYVAGTATLQALQAPDMALVLLARVESMCTSILHPDLHYI